MMESPADEKSAAEVYFKCILPKPSMASGTRYRISLREIEYYQSDPTVDWNNDPDPIDGTGIIWASPDGSRPPSVPYRTRVVYADYVAAW